MVEGVVDKALSTTDSIFAVLLIGTLVVIGIFVRWVLNKNDARENRYIKVIENQSKAMLKMDKIAESVDEIKAAIFKRRLSDADEKH